MAIQIGVRLLVVWIVLCGAACDRFENNQRTMIAKNDKWAIVAVGDLKSAGPYFGRNTVRFEAMRSGAPYAGGVLYEAAAHDRPLAARYEYTDWITKDIVRFTFRAAANSPTYEIRLRNEGQETIQWVKIARDEIFLVLELAPGQAVTLPSAHSWDPALVVTGQIGADRMIRRVAKDVGDGARRVDVIVRGTDVDIVVPSEREMS